MGNSDHDNEGEGRSELINRIVNDAIATYRSSGFPDVARLKSDHPELMPELGNQLDTLISIQAARERARHPSARQDLNIRSLDSDVESLRLALPRYEILEEIHYGGQGIVYKALQRANKRTVALKVLLEGLRATERQRHRFERETELISRLEHPNIVTLYESGVANGRLYYVMQYVDGVPIDDYVLLKDLSVRQIIELFAKVARAVAFAHQNGIIHRDLHPANILVDTAGEPHLMDFGLAKDTYADPDARVSAPGQVVGALPYLSPEQVGAGDGNVDVRSDVYSLGVVLYVLLTEQFPYRIQGPYGVVREEIVARDPTPLRRAFTTADPERSASVRDVSADLEAIIGRALAKEKNHRYQSATSLADDLDSFLSGGAVAARAANRLYLLRKTARRYRVPLGIVAGIIAALALVSIVTAHSLANARRAAELAYEQFDMALKAIDSIEPLAGGTSVRDGLLREISATLPQLSEYASADTAFSAIATKVAERLGDVAAAQGRTAEAQRSYRQFLTDSRADWMKAPTDDVGTANVIRAFRKQAGCFEDPSSTYGEGIAFVEQLGDPRNLGPSVRLELCRLQLQFGEYLKSRETYDPAIPHLEAALALYEIREDGNQDVFWNRLGARVLSALGQIRIQRGEFEIGRDFLDRSRLIREMELVIRPYDTAAHEDVAAIYARLAALERNAGRNEQAVELAKSAVKHYELLHQLDPSVVIWGRRSFTAHVFLGQLYGLLQQVESAEDHFTRAADCLEDMMRFDPNNTDTLADYAFVLMDQGELLEHKGAYDQALEAFQKAYEIRRRLLQLDPSNQRRIKEIAVSLQWLGRVYSKTNNMIASIEHYQEACRKYDEIYGQNAVSSENILNLTAAQASLAGACIRSGALADLEIAQRVLDRAEELLARMRTDNLTQGYEGLYQRNQQAVEINRRIMKQKLAKPSDD